MKHKEVFFAILFMSGIIIGVNLLLKPIPDEKGTEVEKTSMVNYTVNEAKTKMATVSMQLKGINITEIRENTIHGVNTVEIKNPLPQVVNLTGLDYTININSITAARGSYDKDIRLPASGSTTIQLPIRIEANTIDKLKDTWKKKETDSTLYSFVNTLHTDIPIAGENKFVVRIDELLPMIWSPELVASNFDLNKFSLDNPGLDMTLHLRNPNPFDVNINNGQLSVSVDGRHNLTGSIEKEVLLPAKATTPVALQINMKSGDALNVNWKTLFDKKATPYTINFSGQISSNHKMLNRAGFRLRNTGSLSDLLQAHEKYTQSP